MRSITEAPNSMWLQSPVIGGLQTVPVVSAKFMLSSYIHLKLMTYIARYKRIWYSEFDSISLLRTLSILTILSFQHLRNRTSFNSQIIKFKRLVPEVNGLNVFELSIKYWFISVFSLFSVRFLSLLNFNLYLSISLFFDRLE